MEHMPNLQQNGTLAALSALRLRCDVRDMSLEKLKLICKETGQPQCPAACTHLELQCQLLDSIGPDLSLHYTELLSLHLGKNQITDIENLDNLLLLEALHLQENRIERISGLDTLRSLSVLNLTSNKISNVQGLSCLGSLHTLLLADNHLGSLESLQHLAECKGLIELDLSHNQISDIGILDVLVAPTNLQTLSLFANPLSNAADPRNKLPAILPNYRRTVVGTCRALTALDHRPVFPQERKYCNAWLDRQRGESCLMDDLGADLPQRNAAKLEADTLYPVFRFIASPRDLVACAQVNPWWCECVTPRLREVQIEYATRNLDDATRAWESVQGPMEGLKHSDFESLRCQGSEIVGGSLTQLLYALKLLWDAAAASAGPFTILSGGDDQQAAGGGSSGALALDCLPAQEDLPDYPEVESCTWRRQVWGDIQDMINSPDFPEQLRSAVPVMSPERIRHLRALTGSADDLEGVYVQEVDKAAICRSNAPCGILCEWLMAGEQYMYMGLLLDEARARMAEYNKATSPSSACPTSPLPSPVDVVPGVPVAQEEVSEETAPAGGAEGQSQLLTMVGEGCLTENSSAAVADGICDEEKQQGVAERGPGSASSHMASAMVDSLDSTVSRRPVAEDAPITVFERGAATRHDDDVDDYEYGGGGGGDDATEDSPLQLHDISIIL